MKNFDYLEPKTVAEACDLLRRYGGEARPYAGGAYLSIVMKQGLLRPKALINIKKIGELKNGMGSSPLLALNTSSKID